MRRSIETPTERHQGSRMRWCFGPRIGALDRGAQEIAADSPIGRRSAKGLLGRPQMIALVQFRCFRGTYVPTGAATGSRSEESPFSSRTLRRHCMRETASTQYARFVGTFGLSRRRCDRFGRRTARFDSAKALRVVVVRGGNRANSAALLGKGAIFAQTARLTARDAARLVEDRRDDFRPAWIVPKARTSVGDGERKECPRTRSTSGT